MQPLAILVMKIVQADGVLAITMQSLLPYLVTKAHQMCFLYWQHDTVTLTVQRQSQGHGPTF